MADAMSAPPDREEALRLAQSWLSDPDHQRLTMIQSGRIARALLALDAELRQLEADAALAPARRPTIPSPGIERDVETVRAGIRIHPDEPTDVMFDLESRAFKALDRLAAGLREREEEVERLSHFIAGLGWHDFGTHWELVEAGVATPGDDDE